MAAPNNPGTGFTSPLTATFFIREHDENNYALTASGSGAAPTTAGIFQHGCLYTRNDTATGTAAVYQNIGSIAVPSWSLMDVAGALPPLARGFIFVGNAGGVATATDFNNAGFIGVGDGTDYASVLMTRDATITGAGVVTVISANGAFNVGTNITFNPLVNHDVGPSAMTTADTTGVNLTVHAAAGNGTGSGGVATFAGGASGSGATGDGGLVALIGGPSLATNGAGGISQVLGGSGAGSGNGGLAELLGGTPGLTGTGGVALIQGGPGGATSGPGGGVTLSGGAGQGGNSTGGAASLIGGAGQGTANGAAASMTGGASGAGATGNGGDVSTIGGESLATNGNGGSVTNQGGAGNGTGVDGVVYNKSVVFKAITVTALTTDATLTAAQLLGGHLTSNQGGAGTATYTMPLGTAVAAALPATLAVGDTFEFSVTNISTNAAETAIFASAAGMTVIGGQNVYSNAVGTEKSSARFIVRNTGAGTFDVFRA